MLHEPFLSGRLLLPFVKLLVVAVDEIDRETDLVLACVGWSYPEGGVVFGFLSAFALVFALAHAGAVQFALAVVAAEGRADDVSCLAGGFQKCGQIVADTRVHGVAVDDLLKIGKGEVLIEGMVLVHEAQVPRKILQAHGSLCRGIGDFLGRSGCAFGGALRCRRLRVFRDADLC